jgi:hypothetical protein
VKKGKKIIFFLKMVCVAFIVKIKEISPLKPYSDLSELYALKNRKRIFNKKNFI